MGRGTWVIPRLAEGGLPIDMSETRFTKYRLPSWLCDYSLAGHIQSRLDHENFGIGASPDALSPAEMVNDEIGLRISSGRISVRAGVKRFSQSGAMLEDGGVLECLENVVFATGFRMECGFIDEKLLKGKKRLILLI